MFQAKVTVKIETRLYVQYFFPPENRADYVKILYSYTGHWRMRIACWITKDTDTLIILNT
jgi:hypothetical protein